MSEYVIRLPVCHDKQADFVYSNAKRKVIVAGRRGGKTTGVSMLAAEKAMLGRRILEAAPTQEQTSAFWDAVKTYFARPIATGIVYKNETERLLKLPNGGRIRCKTAWNADTLRGDFADLLILDEFSLMEPDTWDVVGAPMLLDNDGDAVFIFTPKRKNHAFTTYARAVGDTTGRWQAWHFTSYDNPYLSAEALAEITADMGQDAYQQEIMAEFLDSEGAVFRNISACMNAPVAEPEAHTGHHIIAGVDWGKQADYTAISVGCATCKQEIDRDRFNKIDYAFQRARLGVMFERWHPASILVESNSIGEPNLEMLQRDGFPVFGFETTATSKTPLIENLALALERAEWQWQADPVWTAELEAYERKVSPNTGRSQYSAPEGLHDDTVIARALMLRLSGRLDGQLFY